MSASVAINQPGIQARLKFYGAANGTAGHLISDDGVIVGTYKAGFEKRKPRRIAHAAKALTTGAGKAIKATVTKPIDQRVRDARLEVCGECELRTPCLGGKESCCGELMDATRPDKPGCGCVLSKKVRLSGERCPLGKW